MRLLTLVDDEPQLTEYYYDNPPHYAILSHTWGPDSEEVSFRDMQDGTGSSKSGWQKLLFCARQAKRNGLMYVWVDTCCIDKWNHPELSEAITSMYRWYRDAAECYVYLADVPECASPVLDRTGWNHIFEGSRWFKRGWTLQELIAPRLVSFYSKNHAFLGTKVDLEEQIHRTTKIPVAVLRGASLDQYTVEERLSWKEGRSTRRVEDGAYCLLGLFDIFMPLLYGEGKNAYVRLEQEIKAATKVEVQVSSQVDSQEKSKNERNTPAPPAQKRQDSLKNNDFATKVAAPAAVPSSRRKYNFDVDWIMSLSESEKSNAAEIVIANCQQSCFHVYRTFALWRCNWKTDDPDKVRLFETIDGVQPSDYTKFTLQEWLSRILHAYDHGYLPSESLRKSGPGYSDILSEKSRAIHLELVEIRLQLRERPKSKQLMVENFETSVKNGLIICQMCRDTESIFRVEQLQHMLTIKESLADMELLYPPPRYSMPNMLSPGITAFSRRSSPAPSDLDINTPVRSRATSTDATLRVPFTSSNVRAVRDEDEAVPSKGNSKTVTSGKENAVTPSAAMESESDTSSLIDQLQMDVKKLAGKNGLPV